MGVPADVDAGYELIDCWSKVLSDRTGTEIVEHEFLELRARLLELGASFDRISRADGAPDPRMRLIDMGLNILGDDQGDKARRIQQLFSREYSPGWRSEYGL